MTVCSDTFCLCTICNWIPSGIGLLNSHFVGILCRKSRWRQLGYLYSLWPCLCNFYPEYQSFRFFSCIETTQIYPSPIVNRPSSFGCYSIEREPTWSFVHCGTYYCLRSCYWPPPQISSCGQCGQGQGPSLGGAAFFSSPCTSHWERRPKGLGQLPSVILNINETKHIFHRAVAPLGL